MSKVFVIDDSVSVCVAVERMLGEHGFDVVWERDAATGLSTVEKYDPDLIICDVILPEIDGYEVCRSLAANPLIQQVPVILISGRVDDEARRKAAEAKATDIIAKPFTAAVLVEAVQRTLAAVERQGDPTVGAVPPELRSRLTDELAALTTVRCQYACILDRDHATVAMVGDLDAAGRSAGSDLAALGGLAERAAQIAGADPGLRLTLEGAQSVQLIEPLTDSYRLVVSLPDGRTLGKARFVLRRLRQRLVDLL